MVSWFEVPPVLSAHCEHWGGGYSVQIVWNKPPGVWTAVEVNVSGRTLRTGEQGEQHVTVSGFQPATAYQVSLAALSGAVRRPEPFVFLCHTDPRGESRDSLVCFTQSDSVRLDRLKGRCDVKTDACCVFDSIWQGSSQARWSLCSSLGSCSASLSLCITRNLIFSGGFCLYGWCTLHKCAHRVSSFPQQEKVLQRCHRTVE